MAEALINALGQGRYLARSAGSQPAGFVHPKSIETLKRHGIETGSPRSKSWDELAGQKFDLVITDENMPRMSGTELVYQVHFDFPDIPFIMLTGYTRQQLEAMAKEHPAIKAIVRKPVSREILEEQIKAVLKNMQGKQESESVVAE